MRIAGAILLAAGMLHLYAGRVLFDARTFGGRAAQSLGDPRVASFASERIVDEVIAQRRDLIAYRPLLVGGTRAIVASEPFRAGFRRAAQGAHAALLSGSAERVALSVPDLGVLMRSALSHDPKLAERVPTGLRAGVDVRPTGRYARALVDLVKLGHRFRRQAFLAIGGGALLLFLGITLPHDRRRALLHAGAVVASVALVLFFPPIARTALTLAIRRPELRPVAAGVFDAFMGDLRLWALVLGGVGVVLASAASSFASHMEIEAIGQRLRARLLEPARTATGELVRAGLLTAAGLFAALRPMATLLALTVIAGALLAFEGLRQLFMLVPPRLQHAALQAEALAEAHQATGSASATRTWLRAALVGVLTLGLVGGAVLFVRSPAAIPETPAVADACNGDRLLCDRRLDEVVFPTAHNSMSAAEFTGWMFPNQELGTVALLRHGIRGLLFDVHYGTPIGDRIKTEIRDEVNARAKFEKAIGKEAVDAAMRIRDRLTGVATGPRAAYLCHGFCEIGGNALEETLEGVKDFLVENPGEVLVFVIEDYVTPADIAEAFRKSGLERFVYQGPLQPPFPTLREMIDADQRLVVFGENETAGVPWFHPAFEAIQETPYKFHTPAEFSCRPNRGGSAAPFFLLNHWIETTPTPRPSNAAIVNAHEFLLARARQCERERGKLPNLVAVDFARTGDVVGVAAVLNGIGGPAIEVEAAP